jgi:hypothetical protein
MNFPFILLSVEFVSFVGKETKGSSYKEAGEES